MWICRVDFSAISNTKKGLQQFEKAIRNNKKLADELCKIIKDDNRKYGLQGMDKSMKDYAPLRPSTIATRKGNGPALAPRGAQSRVIKNFVATATVSGSRIEIVAGWRGADFLKYHLIGYTHRSGTKVEARNPNGIRRPTMNRLRQTVNRFHGDAAKATFRTTPNNRIA